MHIPDGWIDLPTSVAGFAVAGVAVSVSAKRAAVSLKEKATTLPAVVAAYLLVAQLLVIPVGLGTSAHLIGTGLATLLVGPAVAIVCVAVVVVVQALLLADGGVTAIGLNIVNDGVVPALVAWGVFLAGRRFARTHRSQSVLAGFAAGLALLAVSVAVTIEFHIGGTDAVPTKVVAAALGGSHVLLALVEGVLTAVIIAAILRLRPDLVRAVQIPVAAESVPESALEHEAAATEPVEGPT